MFTRLIPVLHDVVAGAKAEKGHLYLINFDKLLNGYIVFTRLIPVLHDVVAGAKAENGHLYLIYML